MLQRLAVWACLGLALDSLGLGYKQDMFWVLLCLFCLTDYLARREGREEALEDVAHLVRHARRLIEEAEKKSDQT